jgi:hypothetical protein
MCDTKCVLRISMVAVLLCWGSQASAQLGGGRINRPIDTPTFSPYINMLRNNGSPGLNYFGLVRPQLEFAQQNQQLGENLQTLQMQQGQPMRGFNGGYGYSQLGVTGHPVVFNSFGQGQFGGGYTGMAAGGGMGGGGMGGQAMGGMNGGVNQGGQGIMGAGGAGFGFSGVSGHPAQFGGIGNSSMGMANGR